MSSKQKPRQVDWDSLEWNIEPAFGQPCASCGWFVNMNVETPGTLFNHGWGGEEQVLCQSCRTDFEEWLEASDNKSEADQGVDNS